jgi:hypothetical protein
MILKNSGTKAVRKTPRPEPWFDAKQFWDKLVSSSEIQLPPYYAGWMFDRQLSHFWSGNSAARTKRQKLKKGLKIALYNYEQLVARAIESAKSELPVSHMTPAELSELIAPAIFEALDYRLVAVISGNLHLDFFSEAVWPRTKQLLAERGFATGCEIDDRPFSHWLAGREFFWDV